LAGSAQQPVLAAASHIWRFAFALGKIAHFFRVPLVLFILIRRKGKQEEFRFSM